MKKLMYLMLIVLSFGLVSCNEIEMGVVGHTFTGYDGGDYVTLTFKHDKTCHFEGAGAQSLITDALTYTVTNTDVRIYFDRSYNWIESARGQLYLVGTYNSKNKELTLTSPSAQGVVVLKRTK